MGDRTLDAILLALAGSLVGISYRNLLRRGRIFISIPIASIATDQHRAKIKAMIDDLSRTLRLEYKLEVFCAYLTMEDSFDPGRQAFRECFKEIRSCDYFVAFLPELLASSTLIEVGYALAKRKNVALYYVEGALPFLLREIETDGLPCMGGRILANRTKVASLQAGIDRLRKNGLDDFPGIAKKLRLASRPAR